MRRSWAGIIKTGNRASVSPGTVEGGTRRTLGPSHLDGEISTCFLEPVQHFAASDGELPRCCGAGNGKKIITRGQTDIRRTCGDESTACHQHRCVAAHEVVVAGQDDCFGQFVFPVDVLGVGFPRAANRVVHRVRPPLLGKQHHPGTGQHLTSGPGVDRFGPGPDVVPGFVSGENVSGNRAGSLDNSATIFY
ncbi:hypothetical protein ES703_57771 [subsurface metagenome]